MAFASHFQSQKVENPSDKEPSVMVLQNKKSVPKLGSPSVAPLRIQEPNIQSYKSEHPCLNPTAQQLRKWIESLSAHSEQYKYGIKSVQSIRKVAYFGEVPYAYAHHYYREQKPPGWLEQLQECVQEQLRTTFNSVLCNVYPNERASMGFHADDEKQLGADPLIASVSLGAPRTFVVRSKWDKDHQWEYLLEQGLIVLMGSAVQRDFEHALKKSNKKQLQKSMHPWGNATPEELLGVRLNITFRKVLYPISPY